MEQIIDY